MVERCDFEQQPSVETEDGRLPTRPCHSLTTRQVHRRGREVPLKAYLEAVEAVDDTTRTAKLKEHAAQLRTYGPPAGKSYWEQFQPTPEFVVMFCPANRYSARPPAGPRIDRTGPNKGYFGHTDYSHRTAKGGRLWLAAGGTCRERTADR